MSTVTQAALADCGGEREQVVARAREFLHGDIFSALADPARREIVLLLGLEGEMRAGEIGARFGLDRTTVSRHLDRMVGAGLARRRKAGREVLYRIETGALVAQLEGLLETLKTHCEGCC